MRHHIRLACSLALGWISLGFGGVQSARAVVAPCKPQVTITALHELDEASEKAAKLRDNGFQFSDDGSSYAYVIDNGLSGRTVIWKGHESSTFDKVYLGLPTNVLKESPTRYADDVNQVRATSIVFLSPAGDRIGYTGYHGSMKYAVIQSDTNVQTFPWGNQDSAKSTAAVFDEWSFQSVSPDLQTPVLYRASQRSIQIGTKQLRLPPDPHVPNPEGAWQNAPTVIFSVSGKHYWADVTGVLGAPQHILIVDGNTYTGEKDYEGGFGGLSFVDPPRSFAAIQLVTESQTTRDDKVNSFNVRSQQGIVNFKGLPQGYAVSSDGAHVVYVLPNDRSLTSSGQRLMKDGKVIAVYPKIASPVIANDGAVAAIVTGNDKSAVFANDHELPAREGIIHDLIIGARAEDIAYFAGSDVTLRDRAYHPVSSNIIVKRFTSDGHLILALEGVSHTDEPLNAADLWADGNSVGFPALRSISRPTWLADDHLTLIGRDDSQHLYKIDMRIVPADGTEPQSILLNLDGTPYKSSAKNGSSNGSGQEAPKAPTVIER